MLVYWETTLACGLACRHCRAEAMPDRSPDELTTEEGLRLLDAVTGFGRTPTSSSPAVIPSAARTWMTSSTGPPPAGSAHRSPRRLPPTSRWSGW